jgi:predicted helicase
MTVEWSSYDVAHPAGLRATDRHVLRPHLVEAVEAERAGFATAERGTLIRACGTGKTFTALRFAEKPGGAARSVLFLAPSIALVAQSFKNGPPSARQRDCPQGVVGAQERRSDDPLAWNAEVA